MVARLHAVAGETKQVADSHRRRTEDVALDRNTILVAAGNLHYRRIADACEEGADRHARHVAVRAAAVGGVDGIDETVEDPRTAVDVFRIGGVGGIQLGGHRELAGPEHALEAPRRGVSRTNGQGITRDRLVLEYHDVSPAR